MSAPKRRLILKSEAEEDLNGIRLYTQQRWGVEQRRRYGAQLRRALRRLVDFPELGSPRDHLYLGCRGLLVERHVIYYRLTGDEIIVGRILHQSQDPIGKVSP